MLTDWTTVVQTFATVIQAASAVVLVVVTVVLVRVTRVYADAAKRQVDQAGEQVKETQLQRFDQYRPVVQQIGDGNVAWYGASSYDLVLRNVGTGVALTVRGVLFPPSDVVPRGQLPPRYTVWREPGLLPGGERSVKLAIGVTIADGDATIAGHQLFAPPRPSDDLIARMVSTQYNVLGRLTLTYDDIFGRKHASIRDYIDLYGWQCVALVPNIPKDLEDIDDEARRHMAQVISEQGRSIAFRGF